MEAYGATSAFGLVNAKQDGRLDEQLFTGWDNQSLRQRSDQEREVTFTARREADSLYREVRSESRSAQRPLDLEDWLLGEISKLTEDARNLKDRTIHMEAAGCDVREAKEGLKQSETRLQILIRSLDPSFWK